MIAIRRRTSEAPLRARVVLAGAFGGLIVGGLGLAARGWLHAGSMYPWKAAALFAVMMAIAVVFIGEHPFRRFGTANRVTMIRSMLLALVAGLIAEPPTPRIAGSAVVLATVAAVLDGVDGWLARRSRTASGFGARFDMETDALLIMVLSVLVWQHGKAGAWVLAGGLMRYGFVAVGRLLPWMAHPLRPTFRGKAIAASHLVGLIVALAPIVPVPLSAIAVAATLAALSLSFAVDVRRLYRKE
jgi:phosphatidylglycerophosphate synthase